MKVSRCSFDSISLLSTYTKLSCIVTFNSRIRFYMCIYGHSTKWICSQKLTCLVHVAHGIIFQNTVLQIEQEFTKCDRWTTSNPLSPLNGPQKDDPWWIHISITFVCTVGKKVFSQPPILQVLQLKQNKICFVLHYIVHTDMCPKIHF